MSFVARIHLMSLASGCNAGSEANIAFSLNFGKCSVLISTIGSTGFVIVFWLSNGGGGDDSESVDRMELFSGSDGGCSCGALELGAGDRGGELQFEFDDEQVAFDGGEDRSSPIWVSDAEMSSELLGGRSVRYSSPGPRRK